MRADRDHGESINDCNAEEFLQAPHVIQYNRKYWMFYGGHNTELGECQICLATSEDGRTFERYQNEQGFSRLFVGPGEARDPMVIRIGDQWVCYYCGHDTGKRKPCKVYTRMSQDLLNWSTPRETSWGGFSSGTGFWSTECPFVIEKDGYYYLFRTSEYNAPARTHVYCSEDPFDFGCGNDKKLVATLRVAAPEIVKQGDDLFISSVEDLKGGIQLAKLKWI
jgi:beta-fructofuranosidase